MKALHNYCGGKQQTLWETSFSLKINGSVVKTLCYILFLTKNDLVIKIFHISRLTVVDIYLSVVTPIILFIQLFCSGVISHSIWMGFAYWYIYLFIFIKVKMTSLYNNAFTWPCRALYLLYIVKRRQSRKPLLLFLYVNRNNIVVENIYFGVRFMFVLLAVIYKYFAFWFFFCLFVPGQLCVVIYYYCTLKCLDFFHCHLNYNNIVCICAFGLAQ